MKSDWKLTINPAEDSALRQMLEPAQVAEVSQSEFDRPMISTFVSTMGGVMTEEAGAITGDLELLTRVTPDGGIEALVRYAGAQDLYTAAGSPVHAVSAHPDQAEHRAAHEHILQTLTAAGRVESGNEMPVDLLTAELLLCLSLRFQWPNQPLAPPKVAGQAFTLVTL